MNKTKYVTGGAAELIGTLEDGRAVVVVSQAQITATPAVSSEVTIELVRAITDAVSLSDAPTKTRKLIFDWCEEITGRLCAVSLSGQKGERSC